MAEIISILDKDKQKGFCHKQICDKPCEKRNNCFHNIPLFSSLEVTDLKKISELLTFRDYKKDEIIFFQGEYPKELTIICKGTAKAYHLTADGREKILYIFSEKDYLGEEFLLGNKKSAYTVAALKSLRTCSLDRDKFEELIKIYPEISIKLLEELGNRVIKLESTLQALGSRRIDARIASLLLDFNERYGIDKDGQREIILPLSREGMANYLGIARETLSRKLKQLEKKKVFRSVGNKKLILLNKNLLIQKSFSHDE